ncbi:hypothetical protein ABEG75_13575 [Pantoea agglomerans]|jgi:hypothetical protein|uniref:hypothetical protein n=1 Tax=Pantoea TaxID=53335 RepID=UPI000534CDAB|nr:MULTISPECIES: hypothetical protein [Pantoea]MDF9910279.1 hypothetical protein [Pantoea brenneri]KYN65161.1 hypothetical protein IU46_008370 [Pantoea agglomerans]MBD8260080.1 hypothetical protein [Pantoea agglomerans]MBT8500084.1 hypothetical protein [Pantoea agglomerans]MCW0936374.1 hypothetical protein [Pantoea sp. RG18]
MISKTALRFVHQIDINLFPRGVTSVIPVAGQKKPDKPYSEDEKKGQIILALWREQASDGINV